MTLRTELSASIQATQTATPDLGSVSATLSASLNKVLTNGTTTDKADLAWGDSRTLAGSAADNLDLAGGSLSDALGVALTFAKVKAILITADAANAADLTIGNGTNPFVGPFGAGALTLTVKPGGCVLLAAPAAGWAVTPSTGDILKVSNGSGGSSTYSIMVIGTSA